MAACLKPTVTYVTVIQYVFCHIGNVAKFKGQIKIFNSDLASTIPTL